MLDAADRPNNNIDPISPAAEAIAKDSQISPGVPSIAAACGAVIAPDETAMVVSIEYPSQNCIRPNAYQTTPMPAMIFNQMGEADS